MLDFVKEYSYDQLKDKLINKKVHFTSNCQFFPNFDVICIVLSIKYAKGSNELLFDTITTNNKKLTIGSNMHNLKFEII